MLRIRGKNGPKSRHCWMRTFQVQAPRQLARSRLEQGDDWQLKGGEGRGARK